MTQPPASTLDHKKYFFDKFGITNSLLERCLGEALSAGGDYADLYFESIASTSIGIDESIVKSASQGVSAGCGIRVLSGERTGYAYTDDLSADRLLHPARAIDLDADLSAKLDLVQRADRAARAYDPRITQVRAGYADELRRILIAASDGTFASDTQPLARLSVFVLAKDGEKTSRGTSGGGGRVEIDFFQTEKPPEHFATEAARQAILQLGAVAAPAGEMEVVLGPGWPGVLLHEAVGHG